MKKLPNKYKLTPDVLEKIKNTAAQLPKFQKSKNGKALNRVLHVQKVGGSVGSIKICEPILVNHEINMQKDYQTHGEEGIRNYIEAVKEMVQTYKNDPTYQQLNN